MARTKPVNSITTREEAERAMAGIDEIDRRFAEWDLAEAEAVQLVRERYAEKRKEEGYVGLEARKAFLTRELQAWAEADSASWERKTLETPYGRLGFRVSQPAVVLVKRVARSFKHALELLEARRLTAYIRRTPEVDREAVLAAEREGSPDAAKLRECGLAVEQREEFWIESNASKDLDEAARKLRAA